MKLVTHTERVVVPKGTAGYVLHMKVEVEASADGALAGHQCDEIMLNLVDLARLDKLSHLEMREWLSKMQTKIRIQFDPRIVK
jgi:hypothetical protein